MNEPRTSRVQPDTLPATVSTKIPEDLGLKAANIMSRVQMPPYGETPRQFPIDGGWFGINNGESQLLQDSVAVR
ncbi:hypothetical protein GCM10010298_12610 [Streptomyces microflavus]|nr:hypothetical protein GCM10010298_12610 [Streptomyces microflavus]